MYKKLLILNALLLTSTVFTEQPYDDIEQAIKGAEQNKWDSVTAIIDSYANNNEDRLEFLKELLKEQAKNNHQLLTDPRETPTPETIPFSLLLVHKNTPLKVLQAITNLQKKIVNYRKEKYAKKPSKRVVDLYSPLLEKNNPFSLWFQVLTYGTAEQAQAIKNLAQGLGIELKLTYKSNYNPTLLNVSSGTEKITPFHVTAYAGNLDTLKFLHPTKAELMDNQAGMGNNALLLAALQGSLDLVKYMVEEQGVPIDTTNNSGLSALDLARFNKHTAVIDYLESKTHPIDESLLTLAQALTALA